MGVGLKVSDPGRYYVSLGYVFRGVNYLSYPVESAFGAGLDTLPDLDRTLSFYGNIWFFFNVHGVYTGPTSAALGVMRSTTCSSSAPERRSKARYFSSNALRTTKLCTACECAKSINAAAASEGWR